MQVPSVHHVSFKTDPDKPARRCCATTHKKGTRCAKKTHYVDENDIPYCEVHLQATRRKVQLYDLYLCHDHLQRFEYKPLRVTTLQKESSSSSTTCPVCMDTMLMNTAVVLEACGHRFHEHCITEWAFQKNSCPLCRTEVFMLETQPDDEDLYSVMDVLESENARAHAREVHDNAFLTTRAYTYEGAVTIALAMLIGA